MILYINGDSHAAAAEAANTYAWAQDDGQYFYLGHAPHPDNLAVSWGKLLSQTLKAHLHCSAESGSSNTRILRSTKEWLSQVSNINDLLVIVQWSTWEREEWLHDGVYYQVGASGADHVPEELQEKYKQFVINTDWQQKTKQAHQEIWDFHEELKAQGIKHIFFNGNNDFSKIQDKENWGNNYIGPYDPALTFDAVIRAKGIDTVAPDSWHFGKDGHSVFHRFMLQYIMSNKFI